MLGNFLSLPDRLGMEASCFSLAGAIIGPFSLSHILHDTMLIGEGYYAILVYNGIVSTLKVYIEIEIKIYIEL